MSIVFDFSIKWRHEFNHAKSGVVVFGESKIRHAKNIMSRKFNLGLDVIKERKEPPKAMLIVVVGILMKQLRKLDAREV